MTPTERSMALLRERGFLVQKVEHWLHFAKRRVDLFGFIDLVALGERTIVGVQTTSAANVSARAKKIVGECGDAARRWLQCGGLIVVHGWGKRGPRNKRKTWECRSVWVVLDGESLAVSES